MSPTKISIVAALSTTGAALGFGNLFLDGGGWAFGPLASIVVVALIGIGGQILEWKAYWIALAQVAAVVALITAIFAGDVAFAGVVPNFDSFIRLGDLATQGMLDARRRVAPINATAGTTLLITFLVAPAAIAVDRLAAARLAAMAGLPLFVMYAVVTAIVRDPLPALSYALPVIGFLAMLWLDESNRKSRWGELSESGHRAGDHLGVSVGALALLLGLIIPAIIPTPNGGLFRLETSNGGTRSPTITASRITDLGGQLNLNTRIKLMTVRTQAEVPPYLRTVVLDRWNVNGWGRVEPEASDNSLINLPALQISVPTTSVSARISIDEFNDQFVPLYYAPRSLSIDSNFQYDASQGVVFSPNRSVDGDTYDIVAAIPNPTAEELRTAPQNRQLPQANLQQPAEVSPEVQQLVDNLTAGATTAYDKTIAINNFFTDPASNFVYSLTVPEGNSGDPLLDFLQNRTGFCEQYASAMGGMLRLAGVPSRVVIGYTPGVRQPNGSWQVTTDDAHAWVEAYIGDAGWIQFDPTPIGTRGNSLDYAPPPGQDPSSSASSSAAATSSTSVGPVTGPNQDLEGQDVGTNEGSSGLLSGRNVALVGGGSVGVLAILSIPAAMRLTRRRRRLAAAAGSDPESAHMAWAELINSARDLNRDAPDTQTPRAIVRGWKRDLRLHEDEAAAATNVMLAEEEASYAPTYTARPDLPDSVRVVRKAMLQQSDRGTRWRANLLPPTWRERRPAPSGDDEDPVDA